MHPDITKIRISAHNFYENNAELANIDALLAVYLNNEIINDFKSKQIANFHDWLIYYSTDGNDLNDIKDILVSINLKIKENREDEVEFEEKILLYHALALYCLEMEITELPEGELKQIIVDNFWKSIFKYCDFLKDLATLEGKIFISDSTKYKLLKKENYLNITTSSDE
jgi:hypothetical protein